MAITPFNDHKDSGGTPPFYDTPDALTSVSVVPPISGNGTVENPIMVTIPTVSGNNGIIASGQTMQLGEPVATGTGASPFLENRQINLAGKSLKTNDGQLHIGRTGFPNAHASFYPAIGLFVDDPTAVGLTGIGMIARYPTASFGTQWRRTFFHEPRTGGDGGGIALAEYTSAYPSGASGIAWIPCWNATANANQLPFASSSVAIVGDNANSRICLAVGYPPNTLTHANMVQVNGPVGATAFNIVSDEKQKKDISPLDLDSVLQAVTQLSKTMISFQYDDKDIEHEEYDPTTNTVVKHTVKAERPKGKRQGFSSQEMAKIIPEAVSEHNEIDLGTIVPLAFAAIGQLSQLVSDMKDRLDKLEKPQKAK